MLLLMLERGVPIHSAIFCNTGWEFPEMLEHMEQLKRYTGIDIIEVRPKKPFSYWMNHHKVIGRTGDKKGVAYRTGCSWPSASRRWCTREKVYAINRYLSGVRNPVSCVGLAADESHRVKDNSKYMCRYPLIEFDVTEEQALKICFDHGFHWGGLYEVFNRVSCFCCPLQRLEDLRKLRTHYPNRWQNLLDMDTQVSENRGFVRDATAHDLDRRFAAEEKALVQAKLF